ncbi:unnamed protein product [Pipistrellus nathusii]|uniref:Uncharacterized protein n=1 Tax=Pipistrellus nathusii TaxID=59473 RepID=A0ABN9Z3T7_PIPNA
MVWWNLWPFPRPRLLRPADVSPRISLLVDWFSDPLGVGISSDSFMEWINEDNLKEFVRGIFATPVRIQDSQSPTVASSSLFGNRLKTPSKLQLVNTAMDGLAIGRTLRNRAFAATTAHEFDI